MVPLPELNFISGNTTDGIYIDGVNVNSNIIQNNYIGVLGDLSSPAGNGAMGIAISGDANLNAINNNIISNSGADGIEVNGSFALGTLNNTFSQNSIYSNTDNGISIVGGAQGNVLPPAITIVTATTIGGTSAASANLEVYADVVDEGEYYIGSAIADASGNWSLIYDPGVIPVGLVNGTAIQTNLGNTSEFSNALLFPLPLPFITTWKTDNLGTSNNNQITIPTFGAGYSYDIYWEEVAVPANNGTEPVGQTGNYTITFPSAGTYRIEISGDFPQIYFANGGDKEKILSVDQWGDIAWTTMSQAFYGCTNLIVPAVDAPDFSGVTSLFYMFRGATSLNQSIDHWNVSTISNFGHMFRDATTYNQSLSSWNLSNVNSTDNMFDGAFAFNQDISSWNLASASSTSSMFFNATSFNQDISSWDVSLVGDFDSMFGGATSFNQNIGIWDVSSGWMFWSMFENATAFDQNLGSWDVSNADYLDDMLNNTALSVANYDATLIGWEALPTLISSINLGAAGLFYCTGEAARTNLESTHGWTITDAGLSCPPANTAYVYWTDSTANQINRSALDGTLFEQYHTEPAFVPSGIAIDTLNNVTYWTNTFGQIKKGTIDATGFINVSDFINDALDFPRNMMGLALDVSAGKIYWASTYDGALKSADLFAADPNATVQTLNSGFDNIISVVVDKTNGKLYYTENVSISGDAIIYQSDLDGTNQAVAFQMPDIGFKDLKLDVANDNIYWSTSNGISSAKLSDIAGTINSFAVQGEALGIDLDLVAGKVYWVDRGIPSFVPPQIGRANFDGTSIEILHSDLPNISKPRFIALDVSGVAGGCANPPTANAGLDKTICQDATLNVVGVIGGDASTLIWTTSGDGTFANNTSLSTDYTPGTNDLTNGTVTFTITTDDPDGAGPCLVATDDIIITFEIPHTADAGVDQTVCQGEPVNLAGTIGGSALSAIWSTSGDGTFDNATLLSAIYTPGANDNLNGPVVLTLTTVAGVGCSAISNAITVYVSLPITVINQAASVNVVETVIIDVTNGATIGTGDVIITTLSTTPQLGTATVNADGSISYTALSGTVGNDSFNYEVCNQCGLCSAAQINITIINVPPVVVIPPSTIMAGGIVTVNVLDGISDDNGNLDPSSLIIISNPQSGAIATLDANGILTVDYTGLTFAGTDQLTIEVCDLDGLCTNEVISINVETPGVVVYNAISPNGDNKHDFLEIENIELFPNNHVKIMNRWGDLVFEIDSYDNNGNNFTGTANKGGSGELPTGTYYYNIVLGDGSKAISGFFSLRQ